MAGDSRHLFHDTDAGADAAAALDDDAPYFRHDAEALARVARVFLTGFPGLVTYAVKANPAPAVIAGLHRAGITAFDVASPAEMALVRDAAPGAALHYHNPIRSPAEIAVARGHGIASWSVDRPGELDKLGDIGGDEIAVRFKLPVTGAAYDFGAKFGAEPDIAVALLRLVAECGGKPSLTFHPGTQCEGAEPWARYIAAAADIARRAGVPLTRLNVGGGFPSHRAGDAPTLQGHFDTIAQAARAAFDTPPPLVCEPGRALAADAAQLVLRIKAVDGRTLFLNDGLYGALGEWRDLPATDRIAVVDSDGRPRRGAVVPWRVFGPTCDSLDMLPAPLPLPEDLGEGDHVIVGGMGAYAASLVTRFNGYGTTRVAAPASTGHRRRAV
ncbi:type III PLP-dependent enzyme [Citreimonas sp.]|uniref:type III PLP-dependent enzyme n=1 Tax=Citreimonas sp. TaxID=3036715 RepID=UPI004057CDB0